MKAARQRQLAAVRRDKVPSASALLAKIQSARQRQLTARCDKAPSAPSLSLIERLLDSRILVQ